MTRYYSRKLINNNVCFVVMTRDIWSIQAGRRTVSVLEPENNAVSLPYYTTWASIPFQHSGHFRCNCNVIPANYHWITPSHLFKGENRPCKRALLDKFFLPQKIDDNHMLFTVYLCGIAEGNEQSHRALDMRFVGLFGIRVGLSVRFKQTRVIICRPTVNSFCAFSIKFSQDDSEILSGWV